MNVNSSEGFDPHEEDIARFIGKPIDHDPYGTSYDVIKHGRHQEKQKGLTDFEGNIKKLAHTALFALEVSKLSADPGYSDPNAPKRNREQLRRDE